MRERWKNFSIYIYIYIYVSRGKKLKAVQIIFPCQAEGHSLHPERAGILQTQFQNIFKSTDVSFLIRIKKMIHFRLYKKSP